ncbi:MAG: hypothetical protein WCA79_03985 [Anaerolineales bacterium]
MELLKYDEAIADFTSGIRIIPTATSAIINRATIYEDQGKYDLAIAEFTKSIGIRLNEPTAFLNRGIT